MSKSLSQLSVKGKSVDEFWKDSANTPVVTKSQWMTPPSSGLNNKNNKKNGFRS